MGLLLALTVLSAALFAAQLPLLQAAWQLSNTEAGWIGSGYFIGYVLAVPVLTSLTDRYDARLIFALGAAILAAGCLGFALFAADGLGQAIGAHALMGLGFAGAYMPGLKGLSDNLRAAHRSRATAFYAASFTLGSALSYPFANLLGANFGWRFPFLAAAALALVAAVLVFLVLPAPSRARDPAERPGLFAGWGPALRNRGALVYSLAYGLHCWELFAFRTWIVGFLAYIAAGSSAPGESWWPAPATLAAAAMLLGGALNILGNELAMRLGRRQLVTAVMSASALLCVLNGALGPLGYGLAALLMLLHAVTIMAESSAVTAGAIGLADERSRGATMAVHSTIGFLGGVAGPLAFGWLLDLGGGEAWLLAYGHLALVILAGGILVRWLRPGAVAGDRRAG
jgi:predicted MFS family arabinose efflux permease